MALSEADLRAPATWNDRAGGTLSTGENEATGTLETFERRVQRRYGPDDFQGRAHVHAIDLTPNHHAICKRYFAALNLPVDLSPVRLLV